MQIIACLVEGVFEGTVIAVLLAANIIGAALMEKYL